jgi:hypothetical protein
MEDEWRSERLEQPVFGGDALRERRRWDWWVTGCWLFVLGLCVAFWVLLSLTLSQVSQ